MSIKNIVTGQLAKITTYTGIGQVEGISTTGDVTTAANVTAAKVSLGTGNLQLTGNTVSSAASIITIDPLGDGTPAGNVVVAGNLQVSGNITYNDIVNATTNDLQWIAANNAANPSAATGAGLAVGPLGAYASFTYNSGSNIWQSSLPLLANGGVNANGALSGATTGSFSGNVTASYFIGNGSSLSQLTGANVTGTVASATVAASANSVTGANVSGQVASATIAASANSVAGANVTGTVASATVAASANSVAGANVSGQVANALVAGTVYTAAQPNITSVGTLTTLAVTGNITGGNINTSGNVTASYFIGNGSALTGMYGNANVVNLLSSGTVSSNIVTTANVAANFFIGDGGLLSNISGGGSYGNSNVASYLPTYTGNLGNVDSIASTGNITVGTGAFFIGDGGLLSNISGGGSYGNSNVASYLPTYTGNLISLTGDVTTTANINGVNFNLSGNAVITGNVGITGNIIMSGGKISGSSGTTPAKLQHYGETVVAGGNLTGTLAINTTLGTIQRYTLTGSITINGFVNAVAGTNATLILKQDATGGRTLTSTMKFLGGVKTLSTAANAIDVLSVFYDGTDYLATLGKGYA